jgi:capsular polysaccharide biosynthesis protein
MEGLNRDIASITELRDRFKQQQENSSISQAMLQDASSAKYRIIEPALLPIIPISPDRVKLTLMGILVGIVLGAAAIFLVELMDSSVQRPEDLEDDLGIPVLATIPKIPRLKRLRGNG